MGQKNGAQGMDRMEIEAEISLLVKQMDDIPQDKFELQLQVLSKLNEMRAYGLPLPQDLIDLEKTLEIELARKSQQ